MTKNFEYLYETKSSSSIEIEDIGNTSIHAYNDNGLEWFLNVETDSGTSFVKQLGPLKADFEDKGKFTDTFQYLFQSFPYSEKRIVKIIDKFLNNSDLVSQVFEISRDDFNDSFKKIIELL